MKEWIAALLVVWSSVGASEQITVVQWNIHKGREECSARSHYDCPPSLQEIAAYLKRANADVVSLNEVAFKRRNYNDDQPALLQQLLETQTGQCWDRHFTAANYPSGGDLGNLLLWRCRLHKQGVFSAGLPSQPTDESRAVGGVTLTVGGRAVTFFSTHLCAPGACTNRPEQVKALLTNVRTFSAPRVLAGDFNARPTDAEISNAANGVTDYVDLWPEAVSAGTATPKDLNQSSHVNNWRPDYLFRSKDNSLSLVRMAIERQTNPQTGFDVSDHSPLVATLTIR
jgi:endonuclease/exonuclease/phosphatase family metal-dependent hydrolase